MHKCYGRKREIEFLRDGLKRKGGSSCIIYGPPGIGKTALLRTFYEGLLKEGEVVVSYTNLYPEIDPFSRLFACQLISLFNNLNKNGRKNDLMGLAGSIRHYLGEATKTKAMKGFLLHIKGYLVMSGFQEVARLADPLWDEEGLFELSRDLSFSLKTEEIISLVRAFEMALPDFRLVLTLDDFGIIKEERPDLFKGMIEYLPEGTHLYFALDKDIFDGLDLEIKEKIGSFELGGMDKDGVKGWIKKEAPDLLKAYGLEKIYQVSQGDPFIISEWIKQGLKGEPPEILRDRGLGFTSQTLNRYDPDKRRYILKIALTRQPLSIPEYARILNVDENMARHYLIEFENDFLISRAYLERENVFYLEHPIKKERIISNLRGEFDLNGLCKELASYSEGRISYPLEEDMAQFWTALRNTLYYYNLIKDGEVKEARGFYSGLITLLREEDTGEFGQSLAELTLHPYFKNLTTRLKIILYGLLARFRMDDPTLFEETLNELDRFVSTAKPKEEFLIEYAKAFFYLANYLGKEEKVKEITDILIRIFSTMVYKNPRCEEIKIIYSHALYNLAYDLAGIQEFDGARNTLEALASLMDNNPDTSEIKVEYAKTLANTSSRLGEAGRFDDLLNYLEWLRTLVESEPKQSDIRIEYAKALTNASFHLGEGERFGQLNMVIENLKNLANAFHGLIEIKLEYARALANASAALSEKGKFKESNGLIEALATLTVNEGSLQEVKNVYVSSLFNLSSDLGEAQRFKALIDILARMKRLILSEPWHEEISLAYARTLYNASYDLGKGGKFDELISNLSLLKELQRQNPHSEIELIYIKTIFNTATDLAKAKQYGQMPKVLSVLEGLTNGEFKNPQTIGVFCKALFNLSSYLGENLQFDIMKETLNLLAALAKRRGGEIRKIYLDALVNTTAYFGKGRNFEELRGIIGEMEKSLSVSENNDMRLAYARVLVNASSHLGRAKRFDELKEILEKGRELFELDPDDERIKVSYLDVLVNAAASLGKKKSLDHLWEIITELKRINDTRGDEQVGTAYAKALIALSDELERRGEVVELNRVMGILEDLSEGNPQVTALLRTVDFPLF